MSQIKEISQGDSLNICLVVNPTLQASIVDIGVSLGNLSASLGSGLVQSGNSYTWKIPSTATQNLCDLLLIIPYIKTTDLGVKKTKPRDATGIFFIESPSQYNVNYTGNVVDVSIEINAIEQNLIASSFILEAYRGFNNYELAVQNGFVGTVTEYLATFSVPKQDAIDAKDAAILANTNAQTAKTAAETARTNAQTAQTAAEAANTAAQTAKAAAQTANTGATTAQTAAETARTAAQSANTTAQTAATTATTKATEAAASATQSAASAASASAVTLGASTGRNSILPTILLDFANTQQLDSRLNFSRTTPSTYFDRTGMLRTAPANVPCFAFDPNTLESLGLQIFESSTNIIWGLGYSAYTITTLNADIAPDGTNTAVKVENTPTQTSWISFSSVAGTDGFYTRSIFIKPNNATNAILYFEGIGTTIGSGGSVYFDANTKTFGGDTTVLIDKGYQICQNGWIRVWMVIEKTATSITGTKLYVGGYGSSSSQHSLLIWGWQVEFKKFVTPYIYTTTTSATRDVDACVFSASLFNLVNQKAGTFLVIIKKPTTQNQNRILGANGTNGGASYLLLGTLASNAGTWDGTTGTFITSPTPSNSIMKLAVSWNAGGTRRLAIDNSTVSSQTTNVFTPTEINIGSAGSTNYFLNSTIKKIAYYSVQLSDTEIRELTSVKLAGEGSNQLPSAGDLGGTAFMQIRSLLAMKARSEVNFHGTGSQVSYTIRRPYIFTLTTVNSNGSTVATLPTANADGTYSAGTNYTLLHNAPIGTQLTLEIIPVLY